MLFVHILNAIPQGCGILHQNTHKQLLCAYASHIDKSFSPQQQLNNMKDESKFKSKQIEARVVEIHHLSKESEVLSSSLQEKKAAATQLQSKLKKRKQVASTQLLGFIKLRTQIAELERKLQEAEEQKQKAELERDGTVQEMKAKEKLKAQLHAHFGKP